MMSGSDDKLEDDQFLSPPINQHLVDPQKVYMRGNHYERGERDH